MSQPRNHANNVERYLAFIRALSTPRTYYEIEVASGLSKTTVERFMRITAAAGAVKPVGTVAREEAPCDRGYLPVRWVWVGPR